MLRNPEVRPRDRELEETRRALQQANEHYDALYHSLVDITGRPD